MSRYINEDRIGAYVLIFTLLILLGLAIIASWLEDHPQGLLNTTNAYADAE